MDPRDALFHVHRAVDRSGRSSTIASIVNWSRPKQGRFRERMCAENYNKWHSEFFSQTAISILLISFQAITVSECCLTKMLPCILFEKYINILASASEMASLGNRHCANCIGTLSFPMARHIFTLRKYGQYTATCLSPSKKRKSWPRRRWRRILGLVRSLTDGVKIQYLMCVRRRRRRVWFFCAASAH